MLARILLFFIPRDGIYSGINLLVQLSYVDDSVKYSFNKLTIEYNNIGKEYFIKENEIRNNVGISEMEKRDLLEDLNDEAVAKTQFLKNEIIHLLKNVIL